MTPQSLRELALEEVRGNASADGVAILTSDLVGWRDELAAVVAHCDEQFAVRGADLDDIEDEFGTGTPNIVLVVSAEGGVVLTTPERRLSLHLKRQELWQQGKTELCAALAAIDAEGRHDLYGLQRLAMRAIRKPPALGTPSSKTSSPSISDANPNRPA